MHLLESPKQATNDDQDSASHPASETEMKVYPPASAAFSAEVSEALDCLSLSDRDFISDVCGLTGSFPKSLTALLTDDRASNILRQLRTA